jgi:tetratricopeptide (TPR) repeat protein
LGPYVLCATPRRAAAFYQPVFPATFETLLRARRRAGAINLKSGPGRGFVLLIVFSLSLLSRGSLSAAVGASSSQADEVCDPLADYFLGMEDYPEAIRRHQLVIKEHPDNALAHYHLGFSYGLMGEHQQELAEYQDAIELGLGDWQLFLNLGLLYLEAGNQNAAMQVLRLATLLGPDRPETHFNLGLAYQRLGMLDQAEQEILLSVQIDPDQIDARNTLGTIYAEEGKYSRAEDEWNELVQADPDYAPARQNLQILQRVQHEPASHDSESGFSGVEPRPGVADTPASQGLNQSHNEDGDGVGATNISVGLAP